MPKNTNPPPDKELVNHAYKIGIDLAALLDSNNKEQPSVDIQFWNEETTDKQLLLLYFITKRYIELAEQQPSLPITTDWLLSLGNWQKKTYTSRLYLSLGIGTLTLEWSTPNNAIWLSMGDRIRLTNIKTQSQLLQLIELLSDTPKGNGGLPK